MDDDNKEIAKDASFEDKIKNMNLIRVINGMKISDTVSISLIDKYEVGNVDHYEIVHNKLKKSLVTAFGDNWEKVLSFMIERLSEFSSRKRLNGLVVTDADNKTISLGSFFQKNDYNDLYKKDAMESLTMKKFFCIYYRQIIQTRHRNKKMHENLFNNDPVAWIIRIIPIATLACSFHNYLTDGGNKPARVRSSLGQIITHRFVCQYIISLLYSVHYFKKSSDWQKDLKGEKKKISDAQLNKIYDHLFSSIINSRYKITKYYDNGILVDDKVCDYTLASYFGKLLKKKAHRKFTTIKKYVNQTYYSKVSINREYDASVDIKNLDELDDDSLDPNQVIGDITRIEPRVDVNTASLIKRIILTEKQSPLDSGPSNQNNDDEDEENGLGNENNV